MKESQFVVSTIDYVSAHGWLSCGQGGSDTWYTWMPGAHPLGGKDGLWAGQIIQMEFITHLKSFHKYLWRPNHVLCLATCTSEFRSWGWGMVSNRFHIYCFINLRVFLYCYGNIFIISMFCLKISLWFTVIFSPPPHSCPHWCWNKWTRRHASRHVKWLFLCTVQILAETAVGARQVVLHKDVQVPTILFL